MEKQTQNAALLVMDMQTAIVSQVPNAASVIAQTAKAIAHARNSNIPVIYVVIGFREGTPELSPNNKGLIAGKQMFDSVDMHDFISIHPDLTPRENEVTVLKKRVSAFTGSDLEVVLRARDIRHIILTGVATSGVILSTLREAADKDFRITVLANGCADRDEEVHKVLLTKIFPRQADIHTVDEWTAAHH